MEKPAASAEVVFAKAIELPAGTMRSEFVAVQCANDTTLRREVESLLRAHDEAGDFLVTPAQRMGNPPSPPATNSVQSAAAMNAATHVAGFLRNADKENVEDFLASLPEGLRQEARERIE